MRSLLMILILAVTALPAAANAWCKKMGISFRVITEDDLFRNGAR